MLPPPRSASCPNPETLGLLRVPHPPSTASSLYSPTSNHRLFLSDTGQVPPSKTFFCIWIQSFKNTEHDVCVVFRYRGGSLQFCLACWEETVWTVERRGRPSCICTQWHLRPDSTSICRAHGTASLLWGIVIKVSHPFSIALPIN